MTVWTKELTIAEKKAVEGERERERERGREGGREREGERNGEEEKKW